MQINPLPILNSYWVIPGRFRAGEHPAIVSDSETCSNLRWLFDNGTNFIIDLSETLGSGIDYSACIINTSLNNNQPVAYKPIPIRDFSTPSTEKIIEILDVIDSALSEGRNIYLHCYAGIGRTGMIVGCYLARQGVNGEKALQTIQVLRNGMPNEYKRSPETDEQRKVVKEWIKGQ